MKRIVGAGALFGAVVTTALIFGDFSPARGREGGSGGSVTAGTSISVSGSTVSCIAASGVAGGCLTTGSQTIAGAKTFSSALNSTVQVYAPTITATVVAQSVLYTNDDSLATYIEGQRSNTHVQADITLRSKHHRDAGSLVELINGSELNPKTVFQIDPEGQVIAAVGQNDSSGAPAFTDGAGPSGHVALTCAANYLVIKGKLDEIHTLYQQDGGRPYNDGGTDVQVESDGGTYYAYGGRHGNVTALSGPLFSSWLFEWKNGRTQTATDSVAWIDFQGFYGQSHQLTYAQIVAQGAERAVDVQAGQSYYGHAQSALAWAVDKQRWYFWNATELQPIGSPGMFNGYHPGGTAKGAATAIVFQRFTTAVELTRLAQQIVVAGTGAAATFTVDVYDQTTSTVLCVSSATACDAAVANASLSCTTTIAKFDDVLLRINSSACTTGPGINVSAEYL